MSEAVIAASAATCIAVLGALLSCASRRRLQRATARPDRLNAQLQEFYGPPYAIFQAEHIAHLSGDFLLRVGLSPDWLVGLGGGGVAGVALRHGLEHQYDTGTQGWPRRVGCGRS